MLLPTRYHLSKVPRWERGDCFTKGFCVKNPFAYFMFVSLVLWLITDSLFILPKGAKDGKITFMSTQSGIFGKVNCWMPGGILHLRRERRLNETGFFFFLLLSKDFWAVCNGRMNHFQHFLSLLLKVALYTERVLTSISAQKTLSLAGVINWAFLKGQRRLGETKDGVHRVYQAVLRLAKLQP